MKPWAKKQGSSLAIFGYRHLWGWEDLEKRLGSCDHKVLIALNTLQWMRISPLLFLAYILFGKWESVMGSKALKIDIGTIFASRSSSWITTMSKSFSEEDLRCYFSHFISAKMPTLMQSYKLNETKLWKEGCLVFWIHKRLLFFFFFKRHGRGLFCVTRVL